MMGEGHGGSGGVAAPHVHMGTWLAAGGAAAPPRAPPPRACAPRQQGVARVGALGPRMRQRPCRRWLAVCARVYGNYPKLRVFLGGVSSQHTWGLVRALSGVKVTGFVVLGAQPLNAACICCYYGLPEQLMNAPFSTCWACARGSSSSCAPRSPPAPLLQLRAPALLFCHFSSIGGAPPLFVHSSARTREMHSRVTHLSGESACWLGG